MVDENKKIKILVVGDSGVGKSSIVRKTIVYFFLSNDSNAGASTLLRKCFERSKVDRWRITARSSKIIRLCACCDHNIYIYIYVRLSQIHTARNGESFWVELWDIGGASRFERARSMFYPGADGLLLVHDVTNSRCSFFVSVFHCCTMKN